MWRVILVDDEEFVRAELAALFPWNRYGFELVGEADNAQVALNMIAITKPDLVITDIRMPEIDGLALISRISKQYPQQLVAVVSAYNDFPYVREALRLGAIDYLIKAEATTETAGLFLERISQTLKNRDSAQYQQQKLTRDMLHFRLLAEESFWRDKLTQASDEAEIITRAHQLGIDIEQSRYGLIYLHFTDYQTAKAEDQAGIRALLQVKIQANWDWNWSWNLIELNRGDFLILASGIGETTPPDAIRKLNQISCRLADETNGTVVATTSSNLSTFPELPDQFRELREINLLHLTNTYPQATLTIRKALHYIQLNFCRDLSLEEVAAHAGVSKSYLSRVFPEYAGEHFSDYIQRLRIERAKELLRYTNDHIYEIASKVGFWNSRYFSKVFHETVGMTPADYRRVPLV